MADGSFEVLEWLRSNQGSEGTAMNVKDCDFYTCQQEIAMLDAERSWSGRITTGERRARESYAAACECWARDDRLHRGVHRPPAKV